MNLRRPSTLVQLLMLFHTSFSQNVELDVNFGESGIVSTDVNGVVNRAHDIALQADGKILAGGHSYLNGSNVDSMTLIRYTSNGIIDSTFAVNGASIVDIGADDIIRSLITDESGSIYACGSATIEGVSHAIIMKYDSFGDPVSSFGEDGIVATSSDDDYYIGNSITLQADNKIVVGGTSYGTTFKFFAARYSEDGSLDDTFGLDGIQNIPIPVSNGAVPEVRDITLQEDGKIILTGRSYNGNDFDAALIRLSPNGSLDTTFGNEGMVITDLSVSNDNLSDLLILPDGKLLAVGRTGGESANGASVLLLKYDSNGALDLSFGINGMATSQISPGNNYGAQSIMQSDGKLLVTGTTGPFPLGDMFVARYTSNGDLDLTFNSTGFVIQDVQGLDAGTSIGLTSGEDIIVGGFGGVSDGLHDFLLARYTNVNVSSFEDLSAASMITLYPNPTNGHLQVSYDDRGERLRYTVYSCQGAVVREGIVEQGSVDVSMLDTGMYHITFHSHDSRQTLGFVKY